MSDKNFDDQIRDAIGDFEAKGDGSWDLLMGKMMVDPELAPESQEVQDFDHAIKTKIENVKPEQPVGNWDAMAERIKQEFSIRRKLIRYKVAEIALVMLAIFTLINVFPGQVNKPFKNIKQQIAKKKQALVAYKNAILYRTAKEKTTLAKLPTASLEKTNTIVEEALETQIIQVVETSTSKDFSNASNVTKGNAQEFKSEIIAEVVAKAPEETFEPRIALAEITSLDLKEPISEIDTKKKRFRGKAMIAKIFAPIKQVRVSMFAGSDYNYIQTPFDDIFDLEQYSRFAQGYQAGVSIGFKNKNIEVETGAIYSFKDYEPRIPTQFLNGPGPPIAIDFDRIQLNMLEVPLNFRYNFSNLTRWKFYGQTGASIHIALLADYDHSNFAGITAQLGPGEPAPKLEEKEFTDGLLEGGSIEENSYFTANLGVGAERLINTRWSLFLQPSIKAYLLPGYNNGLGPNQDRISSFSLITGARVTFGNK